MDAQQGAEFVLHEIFDEDVYDEGDVCALLFNNGENIEMIYVQIESSDDVVVFNGDGSPRIVLVNRTPTVGRMPVWDFRALCDAGSIRVPFDNEGTWDAPQEGEAAAPISVEPRPAAVDALLLPPRSRVKVKATGGRFLTPPPPLPTSLLPVPVPPPSPATPTMITYNHHQHSNTHHHLITT